MTNLRHEARGRACQVRLPGVCLYGPETVVLAHLSNMATGLKDNDLFGAWCCSACHDRIDGRVPSGYSVLERRLYLLDGIIRTQKILLEEGKVNIK